MKTGSTPDFDFHRKDLDLCALTKEIWRRYFFGTKQEIEEFLLLLDPDCLIIGTGKHEVYESSEAFMAEMTIAMEQRRNIKFTLRHFWVRQRAISKNIYLVYGEIDYIGSISDGRTTFEMGSYFSVLYRYSSGVWKVIYVAQAVPCSEQAVGEYFPHVLVGQITKAWEHADKMTELAQKDQLTGLMNRGTFDTVLQSFYGTNCIVAAIYVDLDNFKTVNDTFGHAAGDLVIQKVAEIFQKVFIKEDNIARIGGDEFCAFFRLDTMQPHTVKIIVNRKIEALLKETPIIVCKGVDEVRVTFSIGGCVHRIGDKVMPSDILKIADDAMYEVKKDNKNKNGACMYLEDGSVLRFHGMYLQSSGYRLMIGDTCEPD